MPLSQNTLKKNYLAAGRKLYSTHCFSFKAVKHNILLGTHILLISRPELYLSNEVEKALLWQEDICSGVSKPLWLICWSSLVVVGLVFFFLSLQKTHKILIKTIWNSYYEEIPVLNIVLPISFLLSILYHLQDWLSSNCMDLKVLGLDPTDHFFNFGKAHC